MMDARKSVVLEQLSTGPKTREQMEEATGLQLKRAICYLRETHKVCICGHVPIPTGGRITVYEIGETDRIQLKRQELKKMRKQRETWVTTWQPFRDPMLTAIFGKRAHDE